MTKAQFSVIKVDEGKVFILDDDGGRSITNDAEGVVERCLNLWPDHRIIYRDTDNEWWELHYSVGTFDDFSNYTEEHP